jgi:hypothetical protein
LIDGAVLLDLSEEDLRMMSLSRLGDIKRLSRLIDSIRVRGDMTNGGSGGGGGNNSGNNGNGNNSNNSSNNNNNNNNSLNHTTHENLPPEPLKALIACVYFVSVTMITAVVMVFVHDRVPDMRTYPPLPDIFLDNVPLIPSALKISESCGLILFLLWSLILLLHRHRFILMRRMFSLFGSVFLLRCFTMLMTSLSVPGRHLQCKSYHLSSSWSRRVSLAFDIWSGLGMSLNGVRSCGDYMFSGHTVVLTLLNFFITEYCGLHSIHTLSWVLNLFGIFFILAGHEHYSIDVFVAFYISTRLFLYYHSLANSRALQSSDRNRTKIWFPLFSFFESSVESIVPNVYDVDVFRLHLSRVGHKLLGLLMTCRTSSTVAATARAEDKKDN